MNDTAAASARKSLMVDDKTYAQVSAIAKRHGVTRPLVVEGLLAIADETRLQAALQEKRAEAKAGQAEDRKKRAALASLASQLDLAQIDKLVKQLNLN